MFRKFLTFILLLLIILTLIINLRLSHTPTITINHGDTIQHELLKELRFLKHAIDNRADRKMQSLYPEGYVFLNALYALTWCSFLQHDSHREYKEEGLAEIQKAYDYIDSPEGRSIFTEELPLSYGAFYNGWTNYVLASKLTLQPIAYRSAEDVEYFKQQCDLIAAAIQKTPYPESYPAAAWPADAVICAATLALHDQLFTPKYKDTIANWLKEIKTRLDDKGMLPHAVVPDHGNVDESARGSSMALMLIFIHDIDKSFATEQFALFKEHFVDTRLGLTGIREYPKGKFGLGDVDSGPLLFGFGGAATIVGMQTLALYGEDELSLRVRNAIEAMALPIQGGEEKKYFFGVLPMADAFIGWGHSKMQPKEIDISFTRFRMYSLVVVMVCSFFIYLLSGTKRIPDYNNP